jgi:hypothetical protein
MDVFLLVPSNFTLNRRGGVPSGAGGLIVFGDKKAVVSINLGCPVLSAQEINPVTSFNYSSIDIVHFNG